MELLSYLVNITARSLCLAGTAAACLWLFRIKAAAARHAVWTAVVGGMLLIAVATPVLRPIPVRVMRAAPAMRSYTPLFEWHRDAGSQMTEISQTGRPGALPHWDWRTIAGAAYAGIAFLLLLRLAFGYLFTRRLVAAASPSGEFLESSWITAPMTVGWLRPKILLPSGWREWERAKLDAALAHERAHIRRADWAIAAMAAVNRCVFWFNPLAWFLERRLGVLAEQACDDAALLTVRSRDRYAETLLDIAAAVRSARGRLNWEAMAMAKPSQVRVRVERILDDTRQISSGLSPRRWAALAMSALAAAYLASVLKPVPALAQQPQSAPARAISGTFLAEAEKLTTAEVADLERAVAANPEDIPARTKLIAYYLTKGMNQERAAHVLWLIEHHPESDAHLMGGVFSSRGPLQDAPAYNRAVALWQQQATLHPDDPRVILNATRFLVGYFMQNGDLSETERWLKRARALDPQDMYWRAQLAMLYTRCLMIAANPGPYPVCAGDFTAHARAELESSTDGAVVWNAGWSLAEAERSQKRESSELSEFGKRLQKRAVEELGFQPPRRPTEQELAQAEAASKERYFGPSPLKRVEPVYPPVAAETRIQGTVRLRVLIAKTGFVQDITVVSGHTLLVNAARDAVKQWVYPPQALETLIEVEVPFQLQ